MRRRIGAGRLGKLKIGHGRLKTGWRRRSQSRT
jgi:hypothetical protein